MMALMTDTTLREATVTITKTTIVLLVLLLTLRLLILLPLSLMLPALVTSHSDFQGADNSVAVKSVLVSADRKLQAVASSRQNERVKCCLCLRISSHDDICGAFTVS